MEQIMIIEGAMCRTRPDMRPLAQHMAERILRAVDDQGRFRDPELEAEYQAWKKARTRAEQ